MAKTKRAPATVRSQILQHHDDFGPAERRVARALLARYPMAGLDTVARLAEAAEVSPPTVIRFANRIGFAGFPALQRSLKSELQARMESPLSLYDAYADALAHETQDLNARSMLSRLAAAVGALEAGNPPERIKAVVQALCDRRRHIRCLGGRSSRTVAQSLVFHLNLLRPRVDMVRGEVAPLPDQLLDIGRRDTLFVVDLRRYQADVIAFAEQASRRGARVILLTDAWLSPIAEFADHVLLADIEVPSPFDTLVTAQALVERLLLGCVESLGGDARQRMRHLETARRDFGAALVRRQTDAKEQ